MRKNNGWSIKTTKIFLYFFYYYSYNFWQKLTYSIFFFFFLQIYVELWNVFAKFLCLVTLKKMSKEQVKWNLYLCVKNTCIPDPFWRLWYIMVMCFLHHASDVWLYWCFRQMAWTDTTHVPSSANSCRSYDQTTSPSPSWHTEEYCAQDECNLEHFNCPSEFTMLDVIGWPDE